jgi:cytochrome c556
MSNFKTQKEEVEYLGMMLTATMPNDVKRIDSICNRLQELKKMPKIKNEHSSDFLAKMHPLDIIFNDTEEKEYSEQQLLSFADRFANQRVIDLTRIK